MGSIPVPIQRSLFGCLFGRAREHDLSKIRIVTPIVSDGFRDDAPLRGALPADCDVSQTFLCRGPESVESAVDEVLAGPGVIDAALTAESEGVDAIVIDCMLDPALDAAREAVSIPVIGCGEAGMKAAASQGPFSVVTVLQRQERDFRSLASRYGFAELLVSVRGIGIPVLELGKNREASAAAAVAGGRAACIEDGAQAIVFGCTGMLGLALDVAEGLGINPARVVDPLPPALRVAHEETARVGAVDKSLYPEPKSKRVKGFAGWPALHEKMASGS